LIVFQAVIGLGVAAIDIRNGNAGSSAFYASCVQVAAALIYLGIRATLRAREWKDIERGLGDSLNADLPRPRGETSREWYCFVSAQRKEAARLLAERDAAAAEDMEAFIAAIHAMKTPATAIALIAEKAEHSGEPPRPIDLKLEAEELDRLLELALGRIRLADFERDTSIEEIDLRTLAAMSIRRARRLFIVRGISMDFPDGGATAETDRKWMAFILDQLIVNAAKYASAAVRVTVRQIGSTAEIAVKDDGPGIPEEDRDRIFTKSFVGSIGRAADDAGIRSSGYGLYLALRAAEKLGARISISCAEGGGTIAIVTVPAKRSRFEGDFDDRS